MKFLKYFLILFITISITSCGEDSVDPVFILSNSNISGDYDISSITTEEVETVTSNTGNSSIVLTTVTGVADSFDNVSFVLNANGTYTAEGGFRNQITETPNSGTPIIENDIIVFNASGSYQLDITNNKITFNQQSGDFIEGTFNIISFNLNSFVLEQENIEVDGNTTINFKGRISFLKK